MAKSLTIVFPVPPGLADKVTTAAAGYASPDQLAERVFFAWLRGEQHPKRVRPPSWRPQIVRRWREARAKAKASGKRLSDDRFLAELRKEGIRLCRATLHNWARRLDAGGEAALADRWASRAADYSDDPFVKEIARLRAPGTLTLAECHRGAVQTAKGSGWQVRSYKVVQRWFHRVAKRENRSNGWPATGLRSPFKRH